MSGLEAMTAFYGWRKAKVENCINNNVLLVGMSADAMSEDQDSAFDVGEWYCAEIGE